MELEPGPFAVRDPLPWHRASGPPDQFLSLMGEHAPVIHAIDGQLLTAKIVLAPAIDLRIDPAHEAAFADAGNALDTLDRPEDGATFSTMVAGGGAVDGDQQGQQGSLPGPDETEPDVGLDAPIEPEPAAPPEPPPGKGGPGEGGPGPAPTPPSEDERYQAQVRAAIRRMYLELLEREPDPGGLQSWVDWVIVHGQTLEWVREQIMNSDEYRQKHGG
jgi:hypothetical protein